jgi:hypothetical protein
MRYSAPILILVALAAVGCAGNKTVTGTAPSDGFPAPDKEFVWDVAARALQDSGMQPSSEMSSMQTWTLVTHWRFSPQPFSSQGFRQQATVKILDVPGRPGYYFTETQVKRQVNDNMKEPSKLTMAKWGDETRCAELENLINTRIEMYFLQAGLSENFRKRYGVADDTRRIDACDIDRTQQEQEQKPIYAGPRPTGTYGAEGGIPKPPDEFGRDPSSYGR